MTRLSPITKLMILVGVVAVPYLLWTSSSGTPPGVAQARRAGTADAAAVPADAGEVPKPRELPALQTFAAVVERPLFTPSRRLVRPVETPPTEPEPQAAAPEEAPPPDTPAGTPRPDLRFFGTMRHGKTYAALVTRPGANGSQALAVGDTVDDWRVAEVDRDRLVLEHDAERYTLSIFVKGEGGGANRPAAAQAPPASQQPAAAGGDEGDSAPADEGDATPADESATGDNQGGGDDSGQ